MSIVPMFNMSTSWIVLWIQRPVSWQQNVLLQSTKMCLLWLWRYAVTACMSDISDTDDDIASWMQWLWTICSRNLHHWPKGKDLDHDKPKLDHVQLVKCQWNHCLSWTSSWQAKVSNEKKLIVWLLTRLCRTQFTQQAAISAGSIVSRWANVIEDFSLKRFQQNAAVGREGFSKVRSECLVFSGTKN